MFKIQSIAARLILAISLTVAVACGILGTFSINANGDTTRNPVTVYQQVGSGKSGTGKTFKVEVPSASLVKAA
jgi:hypothetical protein